MLAVSGSVAVITALLRVVLYWLLSTSVREIDPLGLPSPSAFSWSDGTQPSIEEGKIGRAHV